MSDYMLLREGRFSAGVVVLAAISCGRAFSDWRYYASELRLLGIMLLGLYVARRGAVWDPDVRRSTGEEDSAMVDRRRTLAGVCSG